jgi:GTPase SAR1 family protein
MHIRVASLHNPGYDRSAVLEVWDFPSRLEGLVQNYCPDFAILVYDSGDPQSFADTRAYWDSLKGSWKGKVRVFLVGSKFDLWSRDVDIFEDLNGALWKDTSLRLNTEASEWARSEEIDFRLVSCPLNEGVLGLMKTISDTALKSTL